MAEQIPNDVIEFTRGIFAQANLRATTTLARQPGAHEVMLDFQLIAALDEVGPCLLGSGVAIDIQTHWIGWRRHYNGREVADIVILVVLRRGDRLYGEKSLCCSLNGSGRARSPFKWNLTTLGSSDASWIGTSASRPGQTRGVFISPTNASIKRWLNQAVKS